MGKHNRLSVLATQTIINRLAVSEKQRRDLTHQVSPFYHRQPVHRIHCLCPTPSRRYSHPHQPRPAPVELCDHPYSPARSHS